MFGSRAEAISRYLSKGSKVAIEGKLRSQWERDGQKRSKLEVIIDEIEFMSSRNGGGNGGYQGNGGYDSRQANSYSPAPAAPAPAPAVDTSVYDEDIPF